MRLTERQLFLLTCVDLGMKNVEATQREVSKLVGLCLLTPHVEDLGDGIAITTKTMKLTEAGLKELTKRRRPK